MTIRHSVLLLAVGMAVAGLVGAWSSSSSQAYRTCLTTLDVGQGDALLLSLPAGRHWLIDGGGTPGGGYDVGAGRVLPALRRAGVDHLDRVLVSHADGDHFEGLFTVIQQTSVGAIWIPSRRRLPRRMSSLLDSAESRGIPIRVVEAGDDFGPAPAPVQVEVIHPWPGWDTQLGAEERSENNRSLVVRVQLGSVSFLLTGDIEQPTELRLLRAGRVERSTVLKVPHHGSRTSSTAGFVAAVDPLVAVAGIGQNNRYGFPHASVSARYLGRRTALYWTGRHGAVRTCTDGYALSVEQERTPGQWSTLRHWSASELLQWSEVGSDSAGVVGERSVGPVARDDQRAGAGDSPAWRDVRAIEPVKSKAELGAHGAQVSRTPAVSTPVPIKPLSLEPESPPQLEVGGPWKRSRRQRSRLKAPWK